MRPKTVDSGNKACFCETIQDRSPAKRAGHDQPAQREFPIELAEPSQIPSRDFLPWRFSDAESHPAPNNTVPAASENLHISGRRAIGQQKAAYGSIAAKLFVEGMAFSPCQQAPRGVLPR
jgi:hypothetical protein